MILAFVNATGFSATTAMALWITTIGTLFQMPTWWGSLIGAAQLGAAALANLTTPYLIRGMSCEDLGKVASGAAVSAALVMTVSPVAWLFGAAAICLGMAFGVLLGCTNSLLARSHSVQGSYASAQICEVMFAATFYLTAGSIIAAFGLRGIFGLLTILALISSGLLHWLSLHEKSARDADEVSIASVTDRGVWLAVLGFVFFFAGQGAFYQHQVAIGMLIGLDQLDMSRVMATAMIGGMTGAIVGKLIGVRFGVVRPILITTGSLAVALILAVHTASPWLFAFCAMAIQGLTMASIPYFFAILARLDPSGRLPSRGPALLLIGVAGGPLLAETVLRAGGYHFVGFAGATLACFAGLFFARGARDATRPIVEPASR